MQNKNNQYKKVYLGKSKIAGKGIFANRIIKKNETIFSFSGKAVKHSYGPNYQVGSKWLGIGKCVWLNISKNNPGLFINHSCNPNAGFKGTRILVAMKNIKKDEEVTFDYSITEHDPYWKMKCTCGEKNCRKLIRSAKFLPKNLFKKYKPFMPKFAQKSYKKITPKASRILVF